LLEMDMKYILTGTEETPYKVLRNLIQVLIPSMQK
jgi:hypothetical protein